MKALLTILTLLICTYSWGQETKKKKEMSESPPYKETFYVLKDNEEIKHGSYKRNYGDCLITGQFENNKKSGVWECFDWSGQLVQKIDFTNNKIIFSKPFDFGSKYWIQDGESFKEVKPDQVPMFIGGTSAIYYCLGHTLRYPADARRNNVQGEVLVSAVITKEGKMINETVETGLGHGLDEETLRVMQIFPDEWIPGKVNGENIDMKVLFSVKFKLD